MPVLTRLEGAILIVTVDNAPVNALSIGGGIVGDLSLAIERARTDNAVDAVVLTGAGKMFSGGADIGDFESNPEELGATRSLMSQIEALDKPVVAAIHGMALGGGFELALASHYRIARSGTRLGLPEVALGLLPGAGGTQRLPRLIGTERAIAMMVSGKPVSAESLLGTAIEAIEEGDVVDAACAFIRSSKPAPRPTGRLPLATDEVALARARSTLRRNALSKAPEEIIACVERASHAPIDQGLAFEAERFDTLLKSAASAGLRHAFFSERKVSRIPGLDPAIQPIPVTEVAVIGAGTMGTGIAIAVLTAGLRVVLIDTTTSALERAHKKIADSFERDVAKGRLSDTIAKRRLEALSESLELSAVAQADLVIEAVFETMDAKRPIFEALDKFAKEGAILASNTSALDVNKLAELVKNPEQVLGLHFFSPANIMRLLEIVRGVRTSPSVLATAMAFAKRIGKVGVVSGVCDGFIGNRMFEEYLRQAQFLAEEGAAPQRIDEVFERWGWAMGPFRTLDLAGQDVSHSVRQRRIVEMPERLYSRFLDKVHALGRFGQKTGAGVYRYTDGRTAEVDPAIETLLIEHSAEEGIVRRDISDDEILDRGILALINEGAYILQEGIAYRPLDIDMIYLTGYGFPAERGGPMFYADQLGLPIILAKIEKLAQGPHPWAWQPAPLLRELAAQGRSFADLNK